MHDKSRRNPTEIAKDLLKIGCPLPCEYHEYKAELLFNAYDENLGPDKLRIQFEFSSGKDEIEHLTEELNYGFEPFVSDVGSAFGLLLGISLITLVTIFVQSLVAIWNSLKRKAREWLAHALSFYELLKWSMLLVVITYFLASSLTATLIAVLNVSSVQDNNVKLVENPDAIVIGYSIENGIISGNSFSKCSHQEKIGDGFCDEIANTEDCLYDGDDCCNSIKNLKPNQHLYCSDCSCKHKNQTSWRQIKPGI